MGSIANIGYGNGSIPANIFNGTLYAFMVYLIGLKSVLSNLIYKVSQAFMSVKFPFKMR